MFWDFKSWTNLTDQKTEQKIPNNQFNLHHDYFYLLLRENGTVLT